VKPKTEYIFWLSAFFLFVISLMWPGDIPWNTDEAHLISNALLANQNRTLAAHGILGSFGVTYGPIPTWIYQFFLLWTHNLVAVSLFKNFLSLLILSVSLYLISSRLNLDKYPILLVFLSPYLYMYNRLLWDNCFLIPTSVLLFLFYTLFSLHRSRLYFLIIMLLSVVLIHIHLMSGFLLAPLFAVILLFEGRWLKANWVWATIGLLLFFAISLPYLLNVATQLQPHILPRASFVSSLTNAVAGANFFTFIGFGERFLPEIYSNAFILPFPIIIGLVTVSACGILFFLAGLILSVRKIIKLNINLADYSTVDKLALLCLLSIAANMLFVVVTRAGPHPHYFNATWFSYYFFLWQGGAMALARKKTAAGYGVYFASMAVLLACTVSFIHTNGGNRHIYYGATLHNQIDVAQRILEFSPGRRQVKVIVRVLHYQLSTHTLKTLLKLYTYTIQGAGLSHSDITLTVDYRNSKQPTSGWIDIYVVPKSAVRPDSPHN